MLHIVLLTVPVKKKIKKSKTTFFYTITSYRKPLNSRLKEETGNGDGVQRQYYLKDLPHTLFRSKSLFIKSLDLKLYFTFENIIKKTNNQRYWVFLFFFLIQVYLIIKIFHTGSLFMSPWVIKKSYSLRRECVYSVKLWKNLNNK